MPNFGVLKDQVTAIEVEAARLQAFAQQKDAREFAEFTDTDETADGTEEWLLSLQFMVESVRKMLNLVAETVDDDESSLADPQSVVFSDVEALQAAVFDVYKGVNELDDIEIGDVSAIQAQIAAATHSLIEFLSHQGVLYTIILKASRSVRGLSSGTVPVLSNNQFRLLEILVNADGSLTAQALMKKMPPNCMSGYDPSMGSFASNNVIAGVENINKWLAASDNLYAFRIHLVKHDLAGLESVNYSLELVTDSDLVHKLDSRR